MTAAAGRVRVRARVTGTVQGVGFRPFVYRLAHEHGLAGWVLNDSDGVLLEVEGAETELSDFFDPLSDEAPPLARVERVDRRPVPVQRGARREPGFRIVASERGGDSDALIAADAATCSDCLAELRDPGDRRYRYPFINCTNCGPRFTIVRGVPYDRPLTTMAPFTMCSACAREYEDPGDRRFHAQPNACPACGPQVRLVDPRSLAFASPPSLRKRQTSDDPIAAFAARLRDGAIAAVKGLGGYHLVCDAANERAVAALRARKHREHRPFALMVANVESARRLVALDVSAETLLCSAARPIVLAPGAAAVAASVAPGAPELGVMLPYTPLHHLLLADFAALGGGALVMTSGNISDEPIAYRDADALERLSGIADLFLIHDRQIETRTDDSVVRSVRGRPLMLRRSRGYVPEPLTLPIAAPRPLLACGAEQKATFCVARGDRAWVGHHIGDLEHVATLTAYREGVAHFERMFAVVPELVAHDLHPDYLSTQYALELDEVELVGVQHHHAHLAACLAEHGATTPAVGAIFDGTGLGSDGTVWGGELLVGDLRGYQRVGWLWPVRMPGGAAAVRQPWRMARSWLSEALGPEPPLPAVLAGTVSGSDWDAVGRIAGASDLSPLTSSIGRLFDAVGVLCGAPARVSYEGQAAVELEALAWTAFAEAAGGGYRFESAAGLVLDPRAGLRELVAELQRGVPTTVVSARFHAGVAAATVDAVTAIASARGLATAVLSGGVFQNRLLLERVTAGLQAAGLRVLVPERLPPNDGGISFGQAAIAAAQ